jgi:hypothetical protein
MSSTGAARPPERPPPGVASGVHVWLDAATPTTSPAAAAKVSGMRTLPYWIGGVLLAAGLVLGFTPLHSLGTACGSAYHPRDDNELFPPPNDCDGARSQMLAPALALTVVGAGIVVAVAAARAQASSREHRTVLGRPVGRNHDDGE